MELSPATAEDWRSDGGSRSSSPPLPTASGFSHLKRAFLSELIEPIDHQAEIGGLVHVGCQNLDTELLGSGVVEPVNSDAGGDNDDESEDDDDGDPLPDIPRGALLPNLKALVSPAVVIPSKQTFQRYSSVVVAALGGALLTGFSKRSLGSLSRFFCSGLVVTQSLSLLGYAEVRWKSLLTDMWNLGSRKPESCALRSLLDVLGVSIEHKLAMACGVVGGLLIL